MMRRLAVTLFVSVVWLACVGDDPGGAAPPNAATGERLAPCFDDGKCKDGLVCHPTEKICVTASDPPPTDGGGDATTNETDASTADVDVPQCALRPTAKLPCPDAPCGGVNVCCIDTATGARSCSPSCAASTKTFECDTRSACGNNTRCCAIVASETAGTACEMRANLSQSYCTLDPCPGSREACRSGSDCTLAGKSTCRFSEVELVPGAIDVWGFCMAQ